MEILHFTLFIAIGFLLGGIMFCQIIPKRIARKNICEISDDGNPGAFNVFTHCGKKIGALCLILDVLKGFVPVLIASLLMRTDSIMFAFVMVAPVLGHAVGVFNRSHGGKCIAVSFGVMFGILPVSPIGLGALAGLYILFSTAIKINPNDRRTVVVYCLFALITAVTLSLLGLPYIAVGCALIAACPIVKIAVSHKSRRAARIPADSAVSEEGKIS